MGTSSVLPDFPKLKVRIAERYRQRLRATVSARLGVFGEIPAVVMHEGGRSILHRQDGSTGTMQPKRVEATATLKVDPKNLDELSGNQVLEMLDELGLELAQEKLKLFMQSIDEAVEMVGNVSTKTGLEGVFEMLEKRWWEFEEDGAPSKPVAMFGSEETRSRVMEYFREIMETPELRQRYDEIENRKREEWRARQVARKLVE